MIISQKKLSRRTLLRGIGAALSLPFLDAMTPAFAGSTVPGGKPIRAAWFYVPNGIDMRHWTPEFPDHFRLMTNIMIAAFKTDSTRVALPRNRYSRRVCRRAGCWPRRRESRRRGKAG